MWLTSDDGRYGSDAIRLLCNGAKHVRIGFIDRLLKPARLRFINEFSAENARDIKFGDGSLIAHFVKRTYTIFRGLTSH